jgi:hypothetical protein
MATIGFYGVNAGGEPKQNLFKDTFKTQGISTAERPIRHSGFSH